MKKKAALLTLYPLSLAVALGLPTSADAAPGAPDLGFGVNGRVVLPTPPVQSGYLGHTVVVQKDGRILSFARNGGSGRLARFLPDGSLDSGFATTGLLASPFGSSTAPYQSLPRTMLLQPDGAILLIGELDYLPSSPFAGDIALVRVKADGTLDDSFGTGGRVRTSLSTNEDVPRAAALQFDGKVVVVGSQRDPLKVDRHLFFMMRYMPDGTLDPGFGTGGVVTQPFDTYYSMAEAVAIQPDGKIVVAGHLNAVGSKWISGFTTKQALVARFLPNGQLDPTFASGGVFRSMLESVIGARASALAIQPDGKILFGGHSMAAASSAPDDDMYIARLTPDGSLDPDFANDGVARGLLSTNTPYESLGSLDLQPDGKIIATCRRLIKDDAVLRLNPAGTLDNSFDGDGRREPVVPHNDIVFDLALQPDGKFLLASTHGINSSLFEYPLLRFLALDADNNGSAEPWDLTPDMVGFSNPPAPAGSLQTSSLVTISGLGENVKVPVLIENAEYAINGATQYTTAIGYVGNGDSLNVRYTAGTDGSLKIGGMHAPNNQTVIIGQQIVVPILAPSGPALEIKVTRPGREALRSPVGTAISAVFASKLVAETVTPSSFLLKCNGQAIPGRTFVTGQQVAWLQPATALPAGAICEAVLTTAIRGAKGEGLSAPYSWHFMTLGSPAGSRHSGRQR